MNMESQNNASTPMFFLPVVCGLIEIEFRSNRICSFEKSKWIRLMSWVGWRRMNGWKGDRHGFKYKLKRKCAHIDDISLGAPAAVKIVAFIAVSNENFVKWQHFPLSLRVKVSWHCTMMSRGSFYFQTWLKREKYQQVNFSTTTEAPFTNMA